MKRMNVSKLTPAAWPPSQSLHLRRHTTPGSQAPSLSLSLIAGLKLSSTRSQRAQSSRRLAEPPQPANASREVRS